MIALKLNTIGATLDEVAVTLQDECPIDEVHPESLVLPPFTLLLIYSMQNPDDLSNSVSPRSSLCTHELDEYPNYI